MRGSILICLFFFSISIIAQTTANDMIINLKKGAAVVRLYMNKPKIDMLKKTIDDKDTDIELRENLRKTLKDHLKDRESYKKNVISAFKRNYNFSKVYFMNDYDIGLLKSGEKKGYFLNDDGEIDGEIVLNEDFFLIFGKGRNDDEIEISQINGQEMPYAFPKTYNRSVIDIFSFIFSKNKLDNYVEKLNDKLDRYFYLCKNKSMK